VNSLSLITWNWDIVFGRISQIEAMKTKFPQYQFESTQQRKAKEPIRGTSDAMNGSDFGYNC
jgi:hypothetical protein